MLEQRAGGDVIVSVVDIQPRVERLDRFCARRIGGRRLGKGWGAGRRKSSEYEHRSSDKRAGRTQKSQGRIKHARHSS
jgi:hypothetical protein